MTHGDVPSSLRIHAQGVELLGELALPTAGTRGLVLFAHGSGSSRLSPRNRFVAAELRGAGIATLLFDLLSEAESRDRRRVFDVPLLADRLLAATSWARGDPLTKALSLGYFGASTGAAAALVAASLASDIAAVVSRGGRPDLAGEALTAIQAPTLLIVGGDDHDVLDLNRAAYERLRCVKELRVVGGATHLFGEPGALARVVALAADWFSRYLAAAPGARPGRDADLH